MSTALLSKERFANLRASLLHHATNDWTPASCSMANGELLRALGLDVFGDMPAAAERRINQLVFDWARVNHAAYCVRYDDGSESPRPTPKLPKGQLMAPPALLKALQALRYNCDGGQGSGESLKPSLEVLEALIDALKDICLELLPEYKAAEWAI